MLIYSIADVLLLYNLLLCSQLSRNGILSFSRYRIAALLYEFRGKSVSADLRRQTTSHSTFRVAPEAVLSTSAGWRRPLPVQGRPLPVYWCSAAVTTTATARKTPPCLHRYRHRPSTAPPTPHRHRHRHKAVTSITIPLPASDRAVVPVSCRV